MDGRDGVRVDIPEAEVVWRVWVRCCSRRERRGARSLLTHCLTTPACQKQVPMIHVIGMRCRPQRKRGDRNGPGLRWSLYRPPGAHPAGSEKICIPCRRFSPSVGRAAPLPCIGANQIFSVRSEFEVITVFVRPSVHFCPLCSCANHATQPVITFRVIR